MILPESLHPALTRDRFEDGRHKQIKNFISHTRPDEFINNGMGIWLPPESIASTEYHVAARCIDLAMQRHMQNEQAALEIARLMRFNDDTGCWIIEDFGELPRYQVLEEVALYFTHGHILDSQEEIEKDIQICSAEGCVYPRHYDITYGSDIQRREKVRLDLRFFNVGQNGEIRTIWGDILPSVPDSITELRKLQKLCPPFADAKDSPLTAYGISLITIHPVTGCWEVRTFYTRPRPMGTEFLQDSYARIDMREQRRPPWMTGREKMAHRVLWDATGRKLKPGKELNHFCGHHPCGNPLHIQQVSRGVNIKHSYLMREAKEAMLLDN